MNTAILIELPASQSNKYGIATSATIMSKAQAELGYRTPEVVVHGSSAGIKGYLDGGLAQKPPERSKTLNLHYP